MKSNDVRIGGGQIPAHYLFLYLWAVGLGIVIELVVPQIPQRITSAVKRLL
jgi:hypothetical protein